MKPIQKNQTKPDITKSELEKGITIEELLSLKLIPVEKIEATTIRIKGSEELRPAIVGNMLEGKHIGENHKWGLITDSVVQKVLRTAKIREDKILLQLPEPTDIDIEKGITWINYL